MIACTETKPLDNSGVTSAGTVMDSLMCRFILCVVLQAELLAVNVVVGDGKGMILELDLGTLEG